MSDRKQAVIHYRRKRRKIARDVMAFSALIANPFDLGSAGAGSSLQNSFLLPGTARLGVSLDEVTETGDVVVDIAGREYGIAGGFAEKIHRLDIGVRGREVEVKRGSGAPAGNLKLYVLDEWQRPYIIATGVFSA